MAVGKSYDTMTKIALPVGRSGWAIAAGYLAFFAVFILPAPIALGVSIVAIRDIKRRRARGEDVGGMGRAIFGLVMGGGFTLLIVAAFAAQLLGGGEGGGVP